MAQRDITARFREGSRQRRCKCKLDFFPHTTLSKVPVCQKKELQWCNRALDGHLGDVDDHPAARPFLEELAQCGGALERIKIKYVLLPSAVHQAFSLFRPDLGAGGDHQVIVDDLLILRREANSVLVRFDQFDVGENQFHVLWQEKPLGLDHLIRSIHSEGDEQKAGLIVVGGIFVNDHDPPFV